MRTGLAYKYLARWTLILLSEHCGVKIVHYCTPDLVPVILMAFHRRYHQASLWAFPQPEIKVNRSCHGVSCDDSFAA